MELRNHNGGKDFTIPTAYYGNLLVFGRDMEYAQRRLDSMLDLFKKAQEYKLPVVFG